MSRTVSVLSHEPGQISSVGEIPAIERLIFTLDCYIEMYCKALITSTPNRKRPSSLG